MSTASRCGLLALLVLLPGGTLHAAPPVTALAYSPDGRLLAAGTYQGVALIDPARGEVVGELTGLTRQVTAVAFDPGGKRLAVAAGEPGQAGELRLFAVPAKGPPGDKPLHTIPAHEDLIYSLAFSPDGKLLATAGYDRVIKLWDVEAGKEVRALKDHSDTVYGLAFHPQGKLLASASADRAVKVWDVSTGRRLYTLDDPTDWVYAVAWSPDGKHLAAAGVDKSVRVWKAGADGGTLAHSVFAHDGAVLRLIYSGDGKTLYSAGEDRVVKVWDTARMAERRALPAQPDAVLALALRPDGKQLALGRYDGVAVALDAATGSQTARLLPSPPVVAKITPDSAVRGRSVRVAVTGKHLDTVSGVEANVPGVAARILPEGRSAAALQAELTLPPAAPAGPVKLTLKSPAGDSRPVTFIVDRFDPVAESGPMDSPRTGLAVKLPATLVGSIDRAGDADFYRFELKEGEQLGVQVLTKEIGSKLGAVVDLTDANGELLADSADGLLGFTAPATGVYALGVRDREYRGAADMTYRIHAGPVPVVTSVFPLGAQRGTEATVRLRGVHLGPDPAVKMTIPADAAPGSRLPVPLPPAPGGEKPLGDARVAAGEFPEVVAHSQPPGRPLPVPGTANGVIDHPGATQTWKFPAKKGERLLIEVHARRLGSPLDSYVEVLDAAGKPLGRATLRCIAQTVTVFRDSDSATNAIRIEAWNELDVNDYVYLDGEVIRILALPRNPDDDCRFFAVAGRRQTYLGTTARQHSLGTPVYKVEVHPPGSKFPPNGMPVFDIPWRNDDGEPGYDKDSQLYFDPPADGVYQVRVGDSRGMGRPDFAYRLTVRKPRPDFTVSFRPAAPQVWKGNGVPIDVTAERIDGFDGPIAVKLENLPPGFEAPATTIEAEHTTTSLTLWASPGAGQPPPGAPKLRLTARATIGGKEVVRSADGGLPRPVEPGDIVTTTDRPEVTLRPGQEARLVVRVERRNGFK
ncbi:MAG TPA: hypothetical protein VIL46_17000, partial [Gemmataceae bacterium]